MILTTDDLAPCHIDFYEKHITPLEKKYSNFKLVAFTVPRWNNENANDVLKNKEFHEFVKRHEGRLTLAMHGFYHNSYDVSKATKKEAIGKSFKYMKGLSKLGLKVINAYKAPYYSWKSDDLDIAKEAGFRYFFIQDGLVDLESFAFYHRRFIGLVDSHVNPDQKVNKTDRVDLNPFAFLEDIHGMRIYG